MIRGLIFDFDGLILETESNCFASWQRLFREQGAEYSLADYLPIVGTTYGGPHDPPRLLEQRTGRAFDWRELDRRRRVWEMEGAVRLHPLPGVVPLLESARAAGLRVGLASSATHDWVDGHLLRLGLMPAFDAVVCRGDAPRAKPAPDLYLEALRRLQLGPREAVAFEDSRNGSLAAKRAGLWCVAVPSALTATQDFAHVDLRVASMADLTLAALQARFGG